MSFEGREPKLDYYPCRYGPSRTIFRGPAVPLDAPYTAVIGGCEVHGRYVEDPFTDQLAERTGRRVVNLGVMNGGIDAFASDRALLEVIARAETAVVQVMGAQNLSNRFYTVHPRRNDRFLKPSIMLQALYRHVDFSDFTFTRHMLTTLRAACPDRFETVKEELQLAWVARMRTLLSRIPGRRVLLWVGAGADRGLGPEPLFVTPEMLHALEASVDATVRCDVSDTVGMPHMRDMVFAEADLETARHCLTPLGHERVAAALSQVVRRVAPRPASGAA